MGHQTWVSKRAQANEGVGPSLLLSMPSPSRVIHLSWASVCLAHSRLGVANHSIAGDVDESPG